MRQKNLLPEQKQEERQLISTVIRLQRPGLLKFDTQVKQDDFSDLHALKGEIYVALCLNRSWFARKSTKD